MAKPKKKYTEPVSLPMLPLRGLMVFPHMVLHFDAGRKKSIAALDQAMEENQRIFLVAQRDMDVDDPAVDDIYHVGTIACVKQVLRLPGGNVLLLVEGKSRAVLRAVTQEEPYFVGALDEVLEQGTPVSIETDALLRTAHHYFEEYCKMSGRISGETMQSVLEIEDPGQLADIIAANVLSKIEDRQQVLEEFDELARLESVCALLVRETELAGVEKKVQARVRKQIEQNQKDYFLREQIKAIQTELGDKDATDVEDLRERLAKTPMNDEARDKANRELERLSRMAPGSPEIGVSRTYIEWLLDLPWGKTTPDNLDLKRARRILAEDHYGLDEVKQRVIEYLAVCRIKNNMKGPVLCFVGPPGVGKTSIAKSIARALGRKFVQMSLGGVRDEAEIRGHRRTYIGAIPGRIISSIKQAGTMNPVFLFDEIDKMASDVRGDPASAMLEVLDSAQNDAFRDHYLEAPFDLSGVMFITTANSVDTIPRPLLDRMDLQVSVPSVEFEAMRRREKAESSAAVRERVNAARDIQKKRFAGTPITCNAYMTAPMVGEFCRLDAAGEKLLKGAFDRLGLTARSHDKLLRVARTIADLDGSERIESYHLAEAIQYRNTDILRGEG